MPRREDYEVHKDMWGHWTKKNFLISDFRHVMNIVFFLLGDSPTSEFCVDVSEHYLFHLHLSLGNSPGYEFYVPTFRNTLSLFQLLWKWRWKKQNVPELRYIKLRRRGLPQKENTRNILLACPIRVYILLVYCTENAYGWDILILRKCLFTVVFETGTVVNKGAVETETSPT